jgi:hypothetical protein
VNHLLSTTKTTFDKTGLKNISFQYVFTRDR